MTKLYIPIDIPVKKRLNINSGALSVENAQSHVTAGSMLTNRKCRSKILQLNTGNGNPREPIVQI